MVDVGRVRALVATTCFFQNDTAIYKRRCSSSALRAACATPSHCKTDSNNRSIRLGRTKIRIGKYHPDFWFHAGHGPIRSEQPLYAQPRVIHRFDKRNSIYNCHTGSATRQLIRVSPRAPLKAIKRAFDYHFLLFAIEFTNPGCGHRILAASMVRERFLEDLSRAGRNMRPSTLVARFFLHPAHVTCVIEHPTQRLIWEWAQFLEPHNRNALPKPTHFTFFHEVIVKLARDEEDSFGTVRIDKWIAQHGLERIRFLELQQ